MEKILRERRGYVASLSENNEIVPIVTPHVEGVTAQVIIPIVSNGDCLGAVVLLSKTEGDKIDSAAVNLTKLTADILANQFE